ncbi:MAG: SDR family oxidoreductase, partial [Ignavibacteria bacterium]|nr:SDR family oxidoreductase [Ignavibacteria bacterium]
MELHNKVVVVTGGGNGIGRQLVFNLLERGAKVAAVDINEAALQETEHLAENKNLSTHLLDITNREAVDDFATQLIAKYGAVDCIINNAGILQPFVKVNDIGFPLIEKIINVDFYG